MQQDPFLLYMLEAAREGEPGMGEAYAPGYSFEAPPETEDMNWMSDYSIPSPAQVQAQADTLWGIPGPDQSPNGTPITSQSPTTNNFRQPSKTPPSTAPYQMSHEARGQTATPAPGTIEAYIRKAAAARGIDPDVALRVAKHEGGYDDAEPARRGTFATGSSWWPFQLHYGGAGTPYAHYGTVAGMGNDFTERTGYKPGDPAAWAASVDFALDHARKNGWGAWYGRTPAGVGLWDGIPR